MTMVGVNEAAMQSDLGGCVMAEATKLPVNTQKTSASAPQARTPFESLRQEIDRLFDDFGGGFWRSPFRSSAFDVVPFWSRQSTWPAAPAVDFTDTGKAYEITAELPGLDDKNIDVKVANGILTIKGEKQEDKEEKKKDYYLRERNYGAFERSFRVPDGVEADKIDASFKNGVLTVTLPKKVEAQKAEKKIDIKAA
jgi:HSP20 family protein